MIDFPKWMKLARNKKNDSAREKMKEIRDRLSEQTNQIEEAMKRQSKGKTKNV